MDCRVVMLTRRSRSISLSVTDSIVSLRKIVEIGVDGFIPLKAVDGVMVFLCGDMALFNVLCNNVSGSVHPWTQIHSPNTSARNVRQSSLPRRSMPPFYKGLYDSIKWWRTLSDLVIIRIFSFLKCVGPFDMSCFMIPNAEHQSIIELEAWFAVVSQVEYNQK